MSDQTVLRYDQLVAQYHDDLCNQLRGHGTAEYIESWVPDEDHVKSLLNMIEAAQSCGLDNFTIIIGANIATDLDVKRLKAVVEEFSGLFVETCSDGIRLVVRTLHDGRPSPYSAALSARSRAPEWSGELPPSDDAKAYTVEIDGIQLSGLVDCAGSVIAAVHRGARGEVRSALDAMCSIMRERPLIEAAEHGALRLEAKLRDNASTRPVPGIINPAIAHPSFGKVEALVRALYANYRRVSGVRHSRNMYVDPADPAWQALWPSDQLLQIQEVVRAALVASGTDPDAARVLTVESNERVMLAFRSSVSAAVKPRFALDIETALQRCCDRTLQVFLTEGKDANAARRL